MYFWLTWIDLVYPFLATWVFPVSVDRDEKNGHEDGSSRGLVKLGFA